MELNFALQVSGGELLFRLAEFWALLGMISTALSMENLCSVVRESLIQHNLERIPIYAALGIVLVLMLMGPLVFYFNSPEGKDD